MIKKRERDIVVVANGDMQDNFLFLFRFIITANLVSAYGS